jgi:hypothetical protein
MITYERVEFTQMPPESERQEWCEWLRRHGINPSEVPVPGWIERRVPEYQVRIHVYTRNEQGALIKNAERTGAVTETRIVQLEGPPLPFPKAPGNAKLYATIDMCR